MALDNMFEPDTIYVIKRFVTWYRALVFPLGNEPGEHVSDARASLVAELHGRLHQSVLIGRSRVVCVAMFALILAIHPIYMDPNFGRVFYASMADLSHISKDMLSEDCVVWLALILAPMRPFCCIKFKDRPNLLHLVVAHQKRSALWADVRTRV
jgi:hypothetical protein